MSQMTLGCLVVVGALAVATAAVSASPVTDSERIAAGARLAQRDCGECHATGLTDPSRLPDAPPFRLLYQRFDVARLPRAYDNGMFVGHPRMPMISLDADELDNLTRYLSSFIPASERRCRTAHCPV